MSTVIKVEHLSKYYKLGVINNGTFFRDMQTWIARKTGKTDPHSRIGEHKYDPTKEGFWALKDLDFEIQQGDRVGIIGKNGAGKSTLLKILSRITAPTEGKVKIKGRVASLLEVGTGFHGELTGRENIYLNGAILGMKRREVDRKIDEIIDFSEIEQYIDTPVKRYSSGMYVRLAFAVAAHLDSEILIADEVLAVGDASFQKKALGKMNDLSTGQGRTVIFVSHNMAAVQQLCNKGILLHQGRIHVNDNIKTVLNIYDELVREMLATTTFAEIKDSSLKRSSGYIHFLKIELDKKEYTLDEDIKIQFSVTATNPLDGIIFALLIKSEDKKAITVINYVLEENITKKNYHKTFIITLQKNKLRPGRYPLYFWIGDKIALTQGGDPTNFEVIDEITPPIIIIPNSEQKESIFTSNVINGIIELPSTISEVTL